MARRPSIRLTDLKTASEALKQAGREPSALDILPDGTHRWHFTKPANSDDDDLESDFDAIEAKHGLR